MPDRTDVSVTDLARLRNILTTAADVLRRSSAEFSREAGSPGDAFGSSPAGHDAAVSYSQLVSASMSALIGIRETLDSQANAVGAAADGYAQADADAARSITTLHRQRAH